MRDLLAEVGLAPRSNPFTDDPHRAGGESDAGGLQQGGCCLWKRQQRAKAARQPPDQRAVASPSQPQRLIPWRVALLTGRTVVVRSADGDPVDDGLHRFVPSPLEGRQPATDTRAAWTGLPGSPNRDASRQHPSTDRQDPGPRQLLSLREWQCGLRDERIEQRRHFLLNGRQQRRACSSIWYRPFRCPPNAVPSAMSRCHVMTGRVLPFRAPTISTRTLGAPAPVFPPCAIHWRPSGPTWIEFVA